MTQHQHRTTGCTIFVHPASHKSQCRCERFAYRSCRRRSRMNPKVITVSRPLNEICAQCSVSTFRWAHQKVGRGELTEAPRTVTTEVLSSDADGASKHPRESVTNATRDLQRHMQYTDISLLVVSIYPSIHPTVRPSYMPHWSATCDPLTLSYVARWGLHFPQILTISLTHTPNWNRHKWVSITFKYRIFSNLIRTLFTVSEG